MSAYSANDIFKYTLVIKNVRHDSVELVIEDISHDDLGSLLEFVSNLPLGGDSSD